MRLACTRKQEESSGLPRAGWHASVVLYGVAFELEPLVKSASPSFLARNVRVNSHGV
jgi:hypothetical protein